MCQKFSLMIPFDVPSEVSYVGPDDSAYFIESMAGVSIALILDICFLQILTKDT